ncbi:hypothetical protein SDC9_176490 [bioreactor metagenome]|uniref:Uncharacterized protein n=1 Tax=bioreactor metagenome TaxID=1076179 RepID=A0A645GSW7_9ZZZZ
MACGWAWWSMPCPTPPNSGCTARIAARPGSRPRARPSMRPLRATAAPTATPGRPASGGPPIWEPMRSRWRLDCLQDCRHRSCALPFPRSPMPMSTWPCPLSWSCATASCPEMWAMPRVASSMPAAPISTPPSAMPWRA